MLIRTRTPWSLTDNDVTPERRYLSRREIIAAAGATGAMALASGARADADAAPDGGTLEHRGSDYAVDAPLTPVEIVTGFNNFYEFGTEKSDPARYAGAMTTDPWSVRVEGLAERTGVFGLEDVVDFDRLEERIYRHRCVEAWSMVIPWIGQPLADVLARFEPSSDAKYVAFETYLDRSEMRGTLFNVLDWPYVEGLRLDEAMHPLAFMVVGVYGKVLPNQNGAPLRIHVPWKYGFKSAKSIVRIRFTAEQPPTSWNRSWPEAYGFYSNVNPNVRHPRYSQASERVIGAGPLTRRGTEMFNGYGEAVAHLYAGMDLRMQY